MKALRDLIICFNEKIEGSCTLIWKYKGKQISMYSYLHCEFLKIMCYFFSAIVYREGRDWKIV